MDKNTKVLIWSIEHDGWWCADSKGYSDCIELAGVYTLEKALEITLGANYSLTIPQEVGPKGGKRKYESYYSRPHEAIVPIREGMLKSDEQKAAFAAK